ncbi:MAG: AAA family ATPase [Sandaracinobacter sp.]
MFKIHSIKIEGFWGRYNITLPLDPQLNFIIGQNGTGKTTFINMVAAALNADFMALDKAPFRRMELTLKGPGHRNRPKVSVEKRADESTGIDSIEFRIRKSTAEPEILFSLDSLEERRALRRTMSGSNYISPIARRSRDITAELNNLVKTTWLSVHRSALAEQDRAQRIERPYDSSIDMKLYELSQRLTRYYAGLSSKNQHNIDVFQKSVFLSLLNVDSSERIFEYIRRSDPEEEKTRLVEAFDKMGVPLPEFEVSARRFFRNIDQTKEKLVSGSATQFTLSEFSQITSFARIKRITGQWMGLKIEESAIFRDFNLFIKYLNDLLYRKSAVLSSNFELKFQSTGGGEFDLFALSSGEKQLVILLGEALLQEHQPFVYVADEPELSLHVKWQERIVPTISSLNEKAQLLIATHSPDVVGQYSDRVIDMQDILVEA